MDGNRSEATVEAGPPSHPQPATRKRESRSRPSLLWEIAWQAPHRRILVAGSVESFVRETVARLILKPVTVEIAALALRLPEPFPRDLPDRLIASTAMVEGMRVVTLQMRADSAVKGVGYGLLGVGIRHG